MSILKGAKPKRGLSLLLALIMVLTMLPLSAVTASAASSFVENPSWTTISGANATTRLGTLTGLLEQSGTKYIRLDEDIELDYDMGAAFQINGEKHLDLNGHRINYSDGKNETARAMFEVKSGADMNIYDSSAKQTGYIHFDGRLTEDSNYIYRHLFVLDSGAKLTVNGGELEAGRSKQIYVYNYLGYAGYVRQQVAGTAIYVSKGAECVINGGTIRGRGEASRIADVNVNKQKFRIRNAAINNAGTLIVNDGFIKGMGGANVIVEITENNNPTTKIYSGILDTHKVDRHYDGAQDKYHEGWKWGRYGNSTTGADILHRTVDYDTGMLDADNNSRRTWNIYGTSSKTAGEFFKIQSKISVGGVGTGALPSAWNPTKNFWVGVDIGTQSAGGEYSPYYTYDAAKALAQDYKNSTGYQSVITWAVYDRSGNQVSKEINKYPDASDSYNHLSKMTTSELRVNMKDFTAPKGGEISWQNGQKYTLRCTISESWQGQNTWNISSYDEWNFFVTSWDTVNPTITAVQAPTSTGDTADITATASYSGDLSGLYDQLWSYGYYDMKNGSHQPVWQAQNHGDSVYTYTNLPVGPKRLCLNIFGQTIDGLYQNINAATDVLVMPRIEAKQQYGGTYGSWGSYESKADDTFTVSNEAMVRLRAIETGLLKDPISGSALVSAGKTITGDSIKWQWWNSTTQSWEDVERTSEDTGSTNVAGVYLAEDTDGDGSRCILETNRTGTYRAYIICYGKIWYSAAPFKVVSKDYTGAGAYKVSATVSKNTMEYNDGTTVKFTVNSNDAEWGTWKAYVVVKKENVPNGAWEYFKIGSVTGTDERSCLVLSKQTGSVSANYDISKGQGIGFLNIMDQTSNKGIIPGQYTFIPMAEAENGKTAKGEPFTITVEKAATGMDILINYLNVTNGSDTNSNFVDTYTMPTNTKTVTLRAQKIQSNATLPYQGTTTWSSNDTRVATIDSETGELTALRPGTARIKMIYKGSYEGREFNYTRYLDVVVPIAEFKFGEVNWAEAVNSKTKYSDLTMPITQVRSYQGEWLDNNDYYMEAKCTQARYLATGGGFSLNKSVEYNQSVQVCFKAAGKNGHQFYLKPEEINSSTKAVISYVADTNSIKTHIVGGTAMDTAFKLGYNYTSGYGGEYYVSGISGYDDPALCGIVIPVDQPCIKDTNARYVDVVSITTAEPREGDSRYQGDAEEYIASSAANINMMDVKVLTLMNAGNPITVNQSTVSKVSNVQGSGIAYDPVSYSDYIANAGEFSGVVGTTAKPESVAKLTAPRYEAATYFHDLILNANGKDSEGKAVYFAPDVKLFINGRPVELIINGYNNSVDSGYDAQRLNVRYYYVSDPSPAFTSGTVSGLTAPAAGETPISASDMTVSAMRSDGTGSDEALYVSRLTWYVDANNNGKPDDGEENNALTESGTFKANTTYSAYIELAANENMGRIDNQSFTLKLNTGAVQPTILNSTAANGSYTFGKTNPPAGVTVSGTATSFGNDTDDVIIQLIESGNTEAAYEKTVKGKSVSYSIGDVAPGTYTMKVIKQNHVTREYTVTVGSSDVTQDVKICLLGDISGDGKITSRDRTMLARHLNNERSLTDYEFKCADANGDGKITSRDRTMLARHLNNEKSLW